jgi:hypothetical protein
MSDSKLVLWKITKEGKLKEIECVVRESPAISELLEDYGYKKGTKVYVEVKRFMTIYRKYIKEKEKDWFQLLKDNNQYEDFIERYGDLWEEVFRGVE